MRATSLLAALPVAAAAIPLMAAALVPLAVPSAALAERWLRPVPGEVARPFDYARGAPFAEGAHRGADLAARPGAAVRAACGGVVVHAGPVAGQGGVVSVRCGARRVSYLPLASVAVRAGAILRAGAPLGMVAPGHGGLHLGVRREGDPFAYEDPVALLPGFEPPAAPLALPRPRRVVPRRAPRPSAPRLGSPRPALRRLAPAITGPPREGARFASPGTGSGAVAPWPVWLGLTLLLSGAAGSGTIAVRRHRAAQRPLSTTAPSARATR